MDASSDPAATLAEVDRIRKRTRNALASSWYAMVVVGAAALGAAAIAAIALRWLGVYWLAAFTVCWVATAHYYRARALRTGVGGDGRVYAAIWFGFLVALILADSIAEPIGGYQAVLAAQCAVVGVFYLVFARLGSDRILGSIGLGTIVLGAGLAVAGPGHEAALANLCLGAALLLGGLYERSRDSIL